VSPRIQQVRSSGAPARTKTVGTLFGGRVRLERLPTTQYISARTFIQGKYVRKSTGESSLARAKKVATDWFKTLLSRDQLGQKIHGATFADHAVGFLKQVDRRLAAGEITKGQCDNYHDKWSVLKPIIGTAHIHDIDHEWLQQLRQTRSAFKNRKGKALSNSTLKKDLIFVMGVLEYAQSQGVMKDIPKAPSFSSKWTIQRRGRPFLTEAEYKKLHQLAKAQANEPNLNPRVRRQRLHLYWFILISVGGALRVGELESVRWCDCELVEVEAPDGTEDEAVRMLVLGKHSRGGRREVAMVLYGGVYAFKEMLAARPDSYVPEGRIFPESHREGMKQLLKDADLYEYRDPFTGDVLTRDRKSLRPTGITLRLDKGKNISYRDIADWARTSPSMILDYYDQAHPGHSVTKVLGFKKVTKVDQKSSSS
jgi:integrase